jgi:small-conductance mechanosensitive channel
VGYVIIICAELGLLDVSIEHLLVGAGLAGVVLGIAAQQSLSNVFASVVLLLARPFVVGENIRIRSGALGGVFDSVVLSVSLTYVTVRASDGILKIPNSVMLATAVGPITPNEQEPSKPSATTQ